MTRYICRGRRKAIAPNASLITIEVNGRSASYLSTKDTCHDAAYLATEIAVKIAVKIAKKIGATSAIIIIQTTPLVRNQMNRLWRTLKPGTKAGRAACIRAGKGMKIQYV